MILHLEKPIAEAWAGDDPFRRAQQQQGEVFRAKEGRRTLRFGLNEKHYFLKLHQGVGWGEVIKNITQFRWPVTSARNEWLAIQKLQQLNLPTMTMVGYGHRGFNPAKQFSFLITDELINTLCLTEVCAKWAQQPPVFAFKQALIAKVAEIARILHENGINHRDFYLCHFFVDIPMQQENLRMYIIDLHRAQIRKKTPLRWIIKDLGGLYFSALDIGLTSRDVLRFMRVYRRKNTRQLMNELGFWRKVLRRAKQIARREYGKEVVLPSF